MIFPPAVLRNQEFMPHDLHTKREVLQFCVSSETTFTFSAVKKLKSWHMCNYDYASQEKAAHLSHCKRVYILHTDLVVAVAHLCLCKQTMKKKIMILV